MQPLTRFENLFTDTIKKRNYDVIIVGMPDYQLFKSEKGIKISIEEILFGMVKEPLKKVFVSSGLYQIEKIIELRSVMFSILKEDVKGFDLPDNWFPSEAETLVVILNSAFEHLFKKENRVGLMIKNQVLTIVQANRKKSKL